MSAFATDEAGAQVLRALACTSEDRSDRDFALIDLNAKASS
jgi:hypothetical protein